MQLPPRTLLLLSRFSVQEAVRVNEIRDRGIVWVAYGWNLSMGYCDSYRNCDGSETPWTELEKGRKARGEGKQHALIFMTLLDQCSFDELVIVNVS